MFVRVLEAALLAARRSLERSTSTAITVTLGCLQNAIDLPSKPQKVPQHNNNRSKICKVTTPSQCHKISRLFRSDGKPPFIVELNALIEFEKETSTFSNTSSRRDCCGDLHPNQIALCGATKQMATRETAESDCAWAAGEAPTDSDGDRKANRQRSTRRAAYDSL